MNFGYAIALATVIMYWPYFTLVEPYWYLLAVFGCYFVFLGSLSVLLPQFTLCTSLGYMTNYKQLHETKAHHRFEAVKRQQQREMLERAVEADSVIGLSRRDQATKPFPTFSCKSVVTRKTVASVMYHDANGVRPVDDNPREKVLAELVKSDTTNLRNQLPEKSRSNLLEREQTRRPMRSKAVSDGVSAMRTISSAPSGVSGDSRTTAYPIVSSTSRKMAARRHNRRKSISQPGLIKRWQEVTAAEIDRSKVSHAKDDANTEHKRRKSKSESGIIRAWQGSSGVRSSDGSASHSKTGSFQWPTFFQREERGDAGPEWKRERAARLAERRKTRKKVQSASAVLQSWRDLSVIDRESENFASHEALPDIFSEGSSEDDHKLLRSEDLVQIRNNDEPSVFLEEKKGSFEEIASASKDVVDIADVDIVEKCRIVPIPLRNANKARNLHEEDDDDATKTDDSVGNLSDVDVIETTRGITTRNYVETVVPLHIRLFRFCSIVTLARVASLYFVSNSYQAVSHVFGTLVVFFFIGHRVEAFVELSGLLIESNSYVSTLMIFYWAEVVFLTFFIMADLIIVILFHPWKSIDSHKKAVSVSARLDLILSGTVMILLFVSEAQRCCRDESPENLGRLLADRIGPDYDFEEGCTWRWGSRTYDGLGIIEPFTSIIVLRIFRFGFAASLVKRLEKVKGTHVDDSSENTIKKGKSDPLSRGREHGDLAHSHVGHGGATALDLWVSAITQHPEIVEKYGQFSGELLQAMLGLHVDVYASEKISSLSQACSEQTAMSQRKEIIEQSDKPETWQSHIKLTGTKYAKLSPDAQSLIIAGRLGKPVKSMRNLMNFNLSGGLLPTVREGTNQLTNTSSPGLLEFEVDQDRMLVEQSSEFSFVDPYARLVRCMRRCDRRHLPLLTKWVSVDVVITQFEIVYFEAKDCLSGLEENESKGHERALLSALQATKGGKGLRLCDVAVGRKVVGHLDLADVTEVHVEQDDDVASGAALLERTAEWYCSSNDMAVEYWHDDSSSPLETIHKRYARAIRWTIMKEDRLKLTTPSGTLVLRFYSDLECAEVEKQGNAAKRHALSRSIALQWAETVARIAGQNQLNQALPHFGENNDDALRDYLEVVRFHSKEVAKARKKADRGEDDLNFLFGDLDESVDKLLKEPSFRLTPKKHHRSKSFGEREGVSERSVPRPNPLRSLRRSLSMSAARNAEDNNRRIDPSIV
jgi:hypothetical protein